jgi:hypothetical protein
MGSHDKIRMVVLGVFCLANFCVASVPGVRRFRQNYGLGVDLDSTDLVANKLH